MKKILLVGAIAAAFGAPMAAHAESTTINPAISGSTATAKLDFTIVIPAVLYVRIGTGSGIGAANNATVDGITFTVPATNIGDSTVVAGVGGDLNATTPGSVTVRVFSNFGTGVGLNAAAGGQLTSSGGDTIAWTDISVATAALAATTAGYTNGTLAHPALTAAGVGTSVPIAAVSRLVRQETKWTFTYLNTTVKPAGSYGAGTGTNGRLTYTATQV
ncbi:MAG: hypothetical protein CFE43_07770 [Burkholderiales bacterium PBB3]|nr:MAG: hypothetical protein CFE43_07770 [Burkholderiales bacterium PBB3]